VTTGSSRVGDAPVATGTRLWVARFQTEQVPGEVGPSSGDPVLLGPAMAGPVTREEPATPHAVMLAGGKGPVVTGHSSHTASAGARVLLVGDRPVRGVGKNTAGFMPRHAACSRHLPFGASDPDLARVRSSVSGQRCATSEPVA
jgi:hypothetical protein